MDALPELDRIRRNPLLRGEAQTWINTFKLRENRSPTTGDFCKIWGQAMLDYLEKDKKVKIILAGGIGNTEPCREVHLNDGKSE